MKLAADTQAVTDEVAAISCEVRMKRETQHPALSLVIEFAVRALDKIGELALLRRRLIELRHLLDAAGLFDDKHWLRSFLT
jgi:hypothetical protein